MPAPLAQPPTQANQNLSHQCNACAPHELLKNSTHASQLKTPGMAESRQSADVFTLRAGGAARSGRARRSPQRRSPGRKLTVDAQGRAGCPCGLERQLCSSEPSISLSQTWRRRRRPAAAPQRQSQARQPGGRQGAAKVSHVRFSHT